jgi:UPF0755 protein
MTERYRETQAPTRRKRSSAMGRVLGSLFALAIVGGLVAGGLGAYGYMQATAVGPLQASKVVDVAPSLSRVEVATRLHDQGVINSPTLFTALATVNSLRGRQLTLGEYNFPAGASLREVLAIMQSGKVVTYKFTIPEGFTTQMAIERLNGLDAVKGRVDTIPAEGTLLANTFLYIRGTDPKELIAGIKAQQDELVDALWAKRPQDTPLTSKQEFVTLASIVEKETGKASERPLVAAVFLNRLKQNMRLQSDPTIIYGLVGGKGKLERAITRADIDSPTPYNTYQIDRLPPGPIAIPGKAALEAVIAPAMVDYLFFVADGTGGHAFAQTLDEHNANVAKWRASQGQPAEAEPVAPTQAPSPATGTAPAPAEVEPQESLAATGLDRVVPEPDTEPDAVAVANAAEVAPTAATPAAELDQEPIIDVKPGSVLAVGNRLIPIPAERRAR